MCLHGYIVSRRCWQITFRSLSGGGRGIEETNKQAEERRETTDGKRSITRFPDPPFSVRLCIFAFHGDASQTELHVSENGVLHVSSERAQANLDKKKKDE